MANKKLKRLTKLPLLTLLPPLCLLFCALISVEPDEVSSPELFCGTSLLLASCYINFMQPEVSQKIEEKLHQFPLNNYQDVVISKTKCFYTFPYNLAPPPKKKGVVISMDPDFKNLW